MSTSRQVTPTAWVNNAIGSDGRLKKIPLILTRPEGANSAFAAEFPKTLAAQLDFIDSPLLQITSLGAEVGMDPSAAAIFTSVNGVRFAPPLVGRQAYCVGMRTTQAARAAGWEAVCAGQNAEELIAELLRLRPDVPLWHLSGVHVRGQIVDALHTAGMQARRIAIYDQRLLPFSARAIAVLESQHPVIAPLFSPRVAAHFAEIAPPAPQLRVVTLSEAITQALGTMVRYEVLTAPEPTADAMISLIKKQVGTICLG